MLPLNRLLAARIQRASAAMMREKDARVRLTSELVAGARAVKALAWEPALLAGIEAARARELRQLRARKCLDAVCVYLWATTQPLFAVLTFGLMAWRGGELRPGAVFTSLALFNMLIAPLNALPWVVNGAVEAAVSLRRLEAFLLLPRRDDGWAAPAEAAPARRAEADGGGVGPAEGEEGAAPPRSVWRPEPAAPPFAPPPPPAVYRRGGGGAGAEAQREELDAARAFAIFENATFAWRGRAALQNVTLTIPAGRLTAVVGEVGSGKSSLLAALLGEPDLVSGRALVDAAALKPAGGGGAGFVPQAPWAVAGTVRDNVLMGAPLDEDWLRDVLHAAALDVDLAAMPRGGLTRVGDAGATLSGGQRQR